MRDPMGWRPALAGTALLVASACVTGAPGPARVESPAPTVIERPEANPVTEFGAVRQRTPGVVGAHITAHVYNNGPWRTIDATFNVSTDAYVLVAHLGADGRIRVMYPGSPKEGGLVRGGESMRTAPLAVSEDRPGNGYARQISRARSLQAVRDSYDGLGIG